MKSSVLFMILICSALGGCSATKLVGPDGLASFEMTYPETVAQLRQATGSILDNGSNIYPAGRAYSTGAVKIGDILTIVLAESAQASRVTGLTTERVSSNAITGGIFPDGTYAERLAALETLGSTISSEGNGTAEQSASLNGSISAVVVEVMSNGNLVIFGEKQLELNEGSEYIRVRGVVRPEDIQPNNTVLSRRLANAQFSYSGAGELARSTKMPWGTNILFSLWPF